jgi:hypothetical protein
LKINFKKINSFEEEYFIVQLLTEKDSSYILKEEGQQISEKLLINFMNHANIPREILKK